MFNLRGTVRFFAFDPIEAKTMYAGVDGLWRSTDSGESWNLVWPKPSAIQAIEMNSDHADERIVAEPNPLGEIVALAIDPADSRTLCGGRHGRTMLRRSSFRTIPARTWRKEVALPEAPRAHLEQRGLDLYRRPTWRHGSARRPVVAAALHPPVSLLRISRADFRAPARRCFTPRRSAAHSYRAMAAHPGPRSSCRAAERSCGPWRPACIIPKRPTCRTGA